MLQCVVSVYATYLFLNYPTEQNWKTSIQCLVENFRRHLLKSQNEGFRDFSKRLFNFSYWNLSDSLAGSKMSKNKVVVVQNQTFYDIFLWPTSTKVQEKSSPFFFHCHQFYWKPGLGHQTLEKYLMTVWLRLGVWFHLVILVQERHHKKLLTTCCSPVDVCNWGWKKYFILAPQKTLTWDALLMICSVGMGTFFAESDDKVDTAHMSVQ